MIFICSAGQYFKNSPAAAASLQSCLTLCNPIDSSPPGSPHSWDSQGKNTGVGCHFLLQCTKKVNSLSRVWLFATPWTAAYQSPPSMGFSRQQYWSGVPLPSPTTNLDRVLKSLRQHFANKCPYSQSYASGSDGKESACNAGDLGLIPQLGRSHVGEYGNPLQHSCLENPHGQRSLEDYSPWGR